MTLIDGATSAQENLLGQILAGLGETRIERLALGHRDLLDRDELRSLGYTPTAEEEEAARGVSIELAAPAAPTLRTTWEGQLVANAFCELSAEHGLPRVVWFQHPGGGSALGGSDIVAPRTADSEEAQRRVATAAAGTSARLERIELLRPCGTALAVTLSIGEAHAFVRHELSGMLRAFDEAVAELAGSFIETCDEQAAPVFARGCYVGAGGSGCMSSAREDIDCCNPFTTRTRFLLPPAAPRCPVFGAPLIA